MKKLLLTGAMLLALSFTAKAQSTSFESSEGYELGNIFGQQGWTTTPVTDGDITNIENQVISSDDASEGVWSLQLNKEDAFGGQNETIAGAFKDFESTGDFSVSYDIYIGQQSQNDSDFAVTLWGGLDDANSIAAQLQFTFTGEVIFRYPGIDEDTGETVLSGYLFDSEPTWEPETWYNVEVVYNQENDAFTFFLDGEELTIVGAEDGLPSIANGELLSTIAFRHDNYGGFAYIDNVVMTGVVAGVNDNSLSQLSVFPNPSSDVINIANAGLISNIKVADLNGRVVKSAAFDGLDAAQLNIADLASGVYMMTVASDKGTTTKKIIKN